MSTGTTPPPAIAHYRPSPGVHDECYLADGGIRPAYEPLMRGLEAMDRRVFTRRWDEGLRAIAENGLTFNVHGDERGLDRPFQLDPLPFVIGAEEWDGIARGIAQRARVINGLLADVYGARSLLARRLIPNGVVLGHPSFLRPCVGFPVPANARLHVYAADLVRGPDGVFRVVADHTQTPPGAGFALENRIVISRMLPETFRAVRAERLASFFLRLRGTLLDLAPRHRDNPRVVLLTPGSLSETYLEQAYLAQYLGITLAQGDDLTVRDDRVYLKTLGGLEPVDVILRRLADDYCDPLELRNESTLGTLGLLGAARAGQVTIANALGSGVAESSAILPYLEELADELIGERLLMPSAQCRWLGDLPDPKSVLADDVILRNSYSHRVAPIDPRTLDEASLRRLEADLDARPHAYVAQKKLQPSTVPVWQDGIVTSRPLTLRVFAVRTAHGYVVMPGGLARVAPAGIEPTMAFAEKSGSKDTWVVASGAVSEVSLLRPAEAPLTLRRGGIDLPSRIADHLFWLGRYASRTEDIARALRAALQTVADDTEGETDRALAPFVRMLTSLGATPVPEGTTVVEWLLKQITDPTSGLLRPLREALRRNGSSVRDRISGDTWRVLLGLDEKLSHAGDELDANEALGRVNDLVLACSALAGMALENMTRGPGFRFFDLGRRIERAVFTADVVRGTLGDAKHTEREDLEALLRVADSVITYRSRYLTTIQLAPVLDLLVTDNTNPRAIAFQLERIQQHVNALPQESRGALPTEAERLAMRVFAQVTLTDPREFEEPLESGGQSLEGAMKLITANLEALSDAVVTAYLTHALPSRALASDSFGGGDA